MGTLSLLVVALALLGCDTGAGGAAHKDTFLEYLGSTGADFRQGTDNLVSLELHLARSVAHMGDFAIGFDIVASLHWGFKFNHVVGAEETFVAVLFDKEFGSHVAKQMDHVSTVN